jgi:hypothetical protein
MSAAVPMLRPMAALPGRYPSPTGDGSQWFWDGYQWFVPMSGIEPHVRAQLEGMFVEGCKHGYRMAGARMAQYGQQFAEV